MLGYESLCSGVYLKLFIFMPFGNFYLCVLTIFFKEEIICVSEAWLFVQIYIHVTLYFGFSRRCQILF